MKKNIIIIQILLLAFLGIYGKTTPGTKSVVKSADDFFRKTRFIMTKIEKEIYKHLPDDRSKIKFIKEFWEKRDPTPDNFENEARIVYEERIAYANRWFSEGKGGGKSGWDSERGRILLQLGIPDRREFGELDLTSSGRTRNSFKGSLLTTKRLPMERWFYYRFQLYLVFTDTNGFGNFKLHNIPAQLLTAIDLAKMSILDSSKTDLKYRISFKPFIKKNTLYLKIPTKKISFEEKGKNMLARFSIVIYVYKDFIKIDSFKTEKVLDEIDESILKKKFVYLKIPLEYSKKGKYYFDIVLEDKVGQSKYREGIKHKIR